MGGLEWVLELALTGLLAATLFYARRLERALGVLKQDRAALEALVSGFNASTRQAQAGIEQLRAAADTAGRQMSRQTEAAGMLRDDLTFLIDRGERAADRLDALVRGARAPGVDTPIAVVRSAPAPDAARAAIRPPPELPPELAPGQGRAPASAPPPDQDEPERRRSQAERDLMKALRLVR